MHCAEQSGLGHELLSSHLHGRKHALNILLQVSMRAASTNKCPACARCYISGLQQSEEALRPELVGADHPRFSRPAAAG